MRKRKKCREREPYFESPFLAVHLSDYNIYVPGVLILTPLDISAKKCPYYGSASSCNNFFQCIFSLLVIAVICSCLVAIGCIVTDNLFSITSMLHIRTQPYDVLLNKLS